jgi:hypothetical protein
MIKKENTRIWINRIVAFLFGGLLLYVILQVSVVNEIVKQNEKLTIQLDNIQYEPGRLLEESRIYLENNEYEKAKSMLDNLFENHPASEESIEGKELYAAIEMKQEEMDRRWDAVVTVIREEWEKTTSIQMEEELDEQYSKDKEQLQTNMEHTLDMEWDKIKGDIRKEWEEQS